MKSKLLLCSSFMAANICVAAPQTELYGIIDTGIAFSRSNGENKVYQETGFMRPSRFGLKGEENLGNGNRVTFVLEQGFESNNGASSQGGKYAFGREANLNISGKFGKLGFGRIGSFMSGMGSWDPWGPNSGPFATGWGIAASGSSMSDYLRMDNTIAWQSPKFSGWQVMAQYSMDVLGTDLDTYTDNTRFASAGIAYLTKGLNILGIIGYRFNPQVGGKGYADGQTYGFAINKQFTGFKPYFAVQYAKNALSVGKKPLMVFKATDASDTNSKGIDGLGTILGSDVDFLGGTFKASVQLYKGKNKASVDSHKLNRVIFSIGQEFPLSKRSTVYAGTNWGKSWQKVLGEKTTVRALEVFSGLMHRF